MNSVIHIRQATTRDSHIVFKLIFSLLKELFPEDPLYTEENLKAATEKMLTHPNYWVLIAYADEKPVGVVGLNECAAIYAVGSFGEITELYVLSEYRGVNVGAQLIEAAIAFGKSKKWSMMEVGAPDQPKWERTLNFYLKTGFHVVGPRLYKML
jgi:GNAT superfamily N-acetyltransferase